MEESYYYPGKRRGACSCVDQRRGLAYMFRGYPGDVSVDQNSSDSTEKHISVFDFHTNKWHKRLLADNGINPSVDAGAACTIIRDKLYIFSGWKIGHLNNDIHELDLETFEWTKLVPLSKKHEPLLKNKCGVVSYGPDMLFIFGGYGYPLIGQPLQEGASYDWERPIMHGTSIGWTNEMHLYHLRKNIWIVPKTTGVRPPPCAAFTLNWIDQFRVLLFGGRQKPERTNEIHILDMFTWHWSGGILPNHPDQPWPSKRSLHTICCLYDPDCVPVNGSQEDYIPTQFNWLPCQPPDLTAHSKTMNIIKEQQLLLLWGMSIDGNPCDDSWVLHTNTMTWEKFTLPSVHEPRIWHTTECLHTTPIESLVMTFGGATDNLFDLPEHLTPTSDETILFQFGMSSLFKLCQNRLLNLFDDLAPLKPFLPQHVFLSLSNMRTKS